MKKKFLTGSNLFLEGDDELDLNEKDSELLQIFQDLVNSVFEYESSRILYTLKSPAEGYTRHWFVNQKTKMMESFPSKLEVEIIEEYSEDSYLCYAGNCHIVVKKDMLLKKVEC